MNQRHGEPLNEKHLIINDFIVLNKKHDNKKLSMQTHIINQFNDHNNNFNFYKIAENSNLVIYQKKINS